MTREIIVTIGKEKYTSTIEVGEHTILADEPKEVGGQDNGPAPHELLLSSLGTCKAMTVRMYADRKKWPLEKVTIKLGVGIQKGEQQNTTHIKCHIAFEGPLDEEQKKRLLAIADRCPIHKALSNPIIIDSNLVLR